MNRTRDFRRHQLFKRKERAKRFANIDSSGNEKTRKMMVENFLKNANHLAQCSCWMCGNPRKYFNEETIQEKKHKIEKNGVCEIP